MKLRIPSRIAVLVTLVTLLPIVGHAQGTLADYERAQNLRKQYEGAVTNLAGRATWIERTNRFWYRRSSKGDNEFMQFDADTLTKTRLFDHDRLAAALSTVAGKSYKPLELPFNTFTFVNNSPTNIQFVADDNGYRCDLNNYTCIKLERRGFGFVPPQTGRPPETFKRSADGAWEVFVKNYNVYIRTKDKKEEVALSYDGSENNYYDFNSIVWSPDAKAIAAFRVRPGYHRKIQYIQSSPLDQLQPKYSTVEYAKPGDTLDLEQPVLFLVSNRQQINVDNSLLPNAYEMSNPVW